MAVIEYSFIPTLAMQMASNFKGCESLKRDGRKVSVNELTDDEESILEEKKMEWLINHNINDTLSARDMLHVMFIA